MSTRGSELHTLRLDRGITLEDLAEALRLRPQFLEDIEEGRIEPHTITYLKIRRELELYTDPPVVSLEQRASAALLAVSLIVTGVLALVAMVLYVYLYMYTAYQW